MAPELTRTAFFSGGHMAPELTRRAFFGGQLFFGQVWGIRANFLRTLNNFGYGPG